MKKSASLLLSILVACALPALAQEGGVATLKAHAGNVTVSTGGEFIGAETGQRLQAGTRLMLTEDSYATVAYDNNCTVTYSKAGVHTVTGECKPAGGGSNAGVIAGVVGGAALLGLAAGGGGGGDDPPPPPPPVSR